MRVEVVNNRDRRVAVLLLDDGATTLEVAQAACHKFRTKRARNCRLFSRGEELPQGSCLTPQDGGGGAPCTTALVVWLLTDAKESYQGPARETFRVEQGVQDSVTILDGADVWIDPEAVEQVRQAVRSSAGAILRAVGLPDLHHGPTGVAILARTPMPKLPGYDIGCGMALFPTNVPSNISRDRVARCMARLDLDVGEDPQDPQLGTIGGGNHFAELLVLDAAVPLAAEVAGLLNPERAVLLVHSGSRAHGARVFAEHSDGHDLEGYMREHEQLVGWARRNRAEIARRFLLQFAAGASGGADAEAEAPAATEAPVPAPAAGPCKPAGSLGGGGGAGASGALIDIAHNWVERLPDGTFLHRKGAAPSHPSSLSLLPGSRATASYVLVCDGDHSRDLCSVAHGAGRRLSRADARRRGCCPGSDLERGGTVICKSKDLLLEEAPHAYKDVEAVVSCMVQRGMCRVGARLLPLGTYKTRSGAAGH